MAIIEPESKNAVIVQVNGVTRNIIDLPNTIDPTSHEQVEKHIRDDKYNQINHLLPRVKAVVYEQPVGDSNATVMNFLTRLTPSVIKKEGPRCKSGKCGCKTRSPSPVVPVMNKKEPLLHDLPPAAQQTATKPRTEMIVLSQENVDDGWEEGSLKAEEPVQRVPENVFKYRNVKRDYIQGVIDAGEAWREKVQESAHTSPSFISRLRLWKSTVKVWLLAKLKRNSIK